MKATAAVLVWPKTFAKVFWLTSRHEGKEVDDNTTASQRTDRMRGGPSY